ncbi:DUF222 domain-containing protein [Phycicoccus sp. M110.8]|uniref:HNH endonuclease signature motif containing protein n=1 Tax=Phycicoccus sp. M110.8 TaxID=3075433 RepID=UPI0028FDB374|nr:DUF222 domain-containing protein [Phycicoccus sp. M110.8]MDU0314714.1 DUF222 domain-containing protein [Phycicoccus sp. M110.8]
MAIHHTDLPPAGADPAGRPVLGGVRAGVAALGGSVPERIWALTDDEVAQSLSGLADLATATSALLVAVLAEAGQRSLGSGEGWGTVDWAKAQAPMLPVRMLLDAHEVARAMGDLRLSEVLDAVSAGASCGARDESHRESVLPVGKAAQLVRLHATLRGLAEAEHLESATRELLDGAQGPGGLSEKDVATAVRRTADLLRPDRLVEHDADVRRAHRSLAKSRGPCGMSRYTLLLDEEGAAVVDAAVDALSRPRPDADTGEHDPRTPAARRADALVDLVARAVAAPDGQPKQPKAMVAVTVPLEVLQRRCRGAGVLPDGSHLTAETVRRLACDAHVVPAVLGSHGEVLEQGQAVRLFTRPQVRHLWQRDRHCTFPGCSKPPGWTDAHHLVHWVDDGPSDVGNAALLCRAHHTVVHRERYGGRVEAGPRGPRVVWDLRPDSYDAYLEQFRLQCARAGSPPRP